MLHRNRHNGIRCICKQNHQKNTEILCNPVRTFIKQDAKILKNTQLYPLLFVDRDSYESKNQVPSLHLMIGAITMLNHNQDANCYISWHIGEDIQTACAKLYAKRHICSGEELFIQYHNIDEYDFI